MAALAASFVLELLGRFQRLLFSKALLAALGDELSKEDGRDASTAHLGKQEKRSDIAAMLMKVCAPLRTPQLELSLSCRAWIDRVDEMCSTTVQRNAVSPYVGE